MIESERPPKVTDYQHYRCEEVFAALLGWLRAHGVQGNKPLHQMHKPYGSALADLHGLHATSNGLRHADIRTTSAFYVAGPQPNATVFPRDFSRYCEEPAGWVAGKLVEDSV